MSGIKDLVEKLKAGQLPFPEVAASLTHASPIVRLNAFAAMFNHAKERPEAVDELAKAVSDPGNREEFMGVPLAHVALGALIRTGIPRASEIAAALVANWGDQDMEDLRWYLESESISAPF